MATQAQVQDKAVKQSAETVEVSVVEREVGAAFIASGIGSIALGLVIVLTEMPAGAGLKAALTLNSGVGPLSGKTTVSVVAFVLSWVLLHFVFKSKPLTLTVSFVITAVLVILGVLLSYPPVFELFAH
jgi:hypothetical protein